jgi:hypothetical protein
MAGMKKILGIGVLAMGGAIATLAIYQNFFNPQASCACGSRSGQAKMTIGSLNRAQQAYFQEKATFADSFVTLDWPLPIHTEHYRYEVQKRDDAVFHYGYALGEDDDLFSYVGGIFVDSPAVAPTPAVPTITQTILCVADEPGIQPLSPPLDAQHCAPGTHQP